MGACASNKRPVVVRQAQQSQPLGHRSGRNTTTTTTSFVTTTKLPRSRSVASKAAAISTQTISRGKPNSLSTHNNSVKLLKQDSDLNLLPPELQKNWTIISDESIFEREKRMVVMLVNSQHDKPSQLALLDVDFQSSTFGKVVCRLALPMPDEELYSFACMRNTHSQAHLRDELDHLTGPASASVGTRFTLVVPVPSHSRIYVLTLQDASITESNGSAGKRAAFPQFAQSEGASGGNGGGGRSAVLTQMRVQKCITREDLSRWDIGAPLTVCSNNAGRSSTVPLMIATMVDRNGHCKGDLLRLDRRTFCPVDRKRRSINEEDRSLSMNSTGTSNSGSPLLTRSKASTATGTTTTAMSSAGIAVSGARFPHFGGALAIHVRHGVVLCTEWGNLERIISRPPDLKQPEFGSQDLLNSDSPLVDPIYGNSINVWDMRRRILIQTIKLDPLEDGRWPICIRMVHHTELTHGFVCTALGSSIYHLHKSTKTGLFSADRVAKFSPAIVAVGDWIGEVPEIPAFLTDMAISMDDHYLYVCAAFHGFIAQLNISDPFRPNLTQKVFLGGIVHRSVGVLHGGKTPLGKCSTLRTYNTEQRVFDGRTFEGGPTRMQLSLDGRRLFVGNAFLRNWDEHFFPELAERGSMIVMAHIDPVGKNPMKLDMDFAIQFDSDGDKGFYAREMRFLNGDSTSDYV